jgi:outer membrane receptor protein involved in Fe transport
MSSRLLQRAVRTAPGPGLLRAAVAAIPLGVAAGPLVNLRDASAADVQVTVPGAIIVTGSNIGRTDAETSNPVTVVDRATIEQSGKLTLGDLLQDLPAIFGPLTNPRVNNGGGTGASTVSVHGLGASRTLVLVNGHRINNADVNSIPANAVERIEVLTDGASSVYGSDAVGGVVNFILRTNYQGAEFSTDYGISDHDDGQRQGYHFLFGQSTDKGSIMAGVDYNKFDSVLASNRAFSKNAIYYYYGAAHVAGGSQRTPTGYVQLPFQLQNYFGCGAATKTSLSNPGSALGDYKCYTSADGYNFQAHGNVELTPQERTNAFVMGNYKITDNVETYLEVYHDKTQSASQVAPQPIDTLGSPLVIAANSFYNPFGVEFSNVGYRFKTRSVGNGNRIENYSTATDQLVTGFKGTIGQSSWQWNAYFDYGHSSLDTQTAGFINLAKIGDAVGPSYKDSSGNIVCGTGAAPTGSGPIAGCSPINFFDITAPATVAALNAASADTFTQDVSWQKSEAIDVKGNVFDVPGGAVQLAAGIVHRKEFAQTAPDAIEATNPQDYYTCDIGTGCVSPMSGSFTVREAYAELLVPILKDVPFANALNLTLSDRYSRYSDFGSTNNARFALEYRPFAELLLRGTVADVFHAPTVTDLFAGVTIDYPLFIDPCYGLRGTNAACIGVPGDGSYEPLPVSTAPSVGYKSGSEAAAYPIKPESGKSFDYGFLYDVHGIPGLSLSADLWRIYLNNQLGVISAQDALSLCFNRNGGPTCSLIHRQTGGFIEGFILSVQEPTGNLGRVDTNGVDFQANYILPETRLGNFAISLQSTYLDSFNLDPTPDETPDVRYAQVQKYAGHYTTGAAIIPYANFSHWKALVTLNWNLGSWRAQWTTKYFGGYDVGYSDPNDGQSACLYSAPQGCELKYGASVYHDVSAGYTIEPINTRLDVGIDNVTDKAPSIIYQNNTLNGNVDANTFDTVGRFYWARVTVKF